MRPVTARCSCAFIALFFGAPMVPVACASAESRPALEIHLSDIASREPWRAVSVIEDLCFARIYGRGPAGYAANSS